MSKYVPIRFNDAEAAFLQRSFAVSEDEALGTHIKRVYFDGLRPNTDALQGMRAELEHIGSAIPRLRDAEADTADPPPAASPRPPGRATSRR